MILNMAYILKNSGSAPIYRETELLMLHCLEMVERVPNSVGIRRLTERLIDTLTDCLTTIGLALNENNAESKLELITSFYLELRTVKTCIDTLKEWSNRSQSVRIISNKQMPHFAKALQSIFKQAAEWRRKVAEQNSL